MTRVFEVQVSTLQRLEATLQVNANTPEEAKALAGLETDINWVIDNEYNGKLTVNSVEDTTEKQKSERNSTESPHSRPPGPGHHTLDV